MQSWDNLKRVPVGKAVDREVTVECKDAFEAPSLGQRHQRCIGEVHWEVAILCYQSMGPPRHGFVGAFGDQVTPGHDLPESRPTAPAQGAADRVREPGRLLRITAASSPPLTSE